MRYKMLQCCCCGNGTHGHQWWNRDTGYGLCEACIEFCGADVPLGTVAQSYGIRGYHYDVHNSGLSNPAIQEQIAQLLNKSK